MKGKVEHVTILRALATILVVVIHVTANPLVLVKDNIIFSIFNFISTISKPAVYIFIFISGFLIMYEYSNKRIEYINYVKKKIVKVFIPYFVWSLLYYCLAVIVSFKFFDVFYFFKGILMGSHLYHLYFVIIIFQFYLLAPVLKVFVLKFDFKYGIVLSFLANYLFWLGDFANNYIFFTNYLLIFMIGAYAGKSSVNFIKFVKGNNFKIILLFALSTVFYSWIQYKQFYLGQYPSIMEYNLSFVSLGGAGSLFYFLLSDAILNYFERVVTVLKKISTVSFYVYLAHPVAIFIVAYLFRKFGFMNELIESFISLIAVFGLVVPFSWLYYTNKKVFKNRVNILCRV